MPPERRLPRFYSLAQYEQIAVGDEICHAVQDQHLVDVVFRDILGERGLIVSGVKEMDLRKIRCEEGGEYSAANARLIAELELLAEAEQLNLKNIL